MADDVISIKVIAESSSVDKTNKSVDNLASTLLKTEKEALKIRKAFKLLDSAVNSGKINHQKYSKMVNELNVQETILYKNLGKTTNAVGQQSASMSNAAQNAKKFADAQRLAGKSTNKFGMYAQQVGYQVGDFFVQVQSGTSALVAFGQQGTQLAGLLPGVAGAVIGIGLSLGTMLLKTFLDTKDAGKQLEESIKGVENALSNLSNVSSMLRDTLGAPFSEANTQLREYLELLEKSSAANVQKQVSLAFGAKGESTGILNELALMAEDMTEPPWWAGEKFGGSKKEIEDANELLRVREEIAEILRGTAAQPRVIEGAEGLRKLGDDLLAYSKQFNGVLGERIRTLMFESGLTQLMVDDEKAKGDAANDALEEHATEMEAFYDMIAKEDKDEAKRKSDLMKKQWDALYKNRMEAKKAAEEASKREATAIASSKVQIEQASVKQALQEAELQYGSKSIEHREAQVKAAKELARITAEQKFIADGITDAEQDQIDLLVEAAGEAETLSQALEDSKNNARDLAAALRDVERSMMNLEKLGGTIDQKIAVLMAETSALQAGEGIKGARIKGEIASLKSQIETAFREANDAANAAYAEATKKVMTTIGQGDFSAQIPTDVLPSVERAAAATRDAALAKARELRQERMTGFEGGLSTLEFYMEEKARLEALERSGGKSGGKDKKSPGLIMTEELFAMKQKLDLQEASLGKSEEEILFEKNKSQLLSKITDQMVGMSEVDKAFYIQQAEGAAEYITNKQLELIALQEIEQQQKEVADTIANSMGSALTSIVDGTKSVKDAFKDMARAIIAELYQIYVVKQITGMISAAINPYMPTFTPSENGNVFSNGNLVPYADGGVVGGPTYFPMAGGRTGLMGESGPEAIMPLKRGKNGKLGVQADGGSGDVIIHQNFNFTANGDESVKKIIAQQAPAIANMTKKQILDDRRRGGQMKQAFG